MRYVHIGGDVVPWKKKEVRAFINAAQSD